VRAMGTTGRGVAGTTSGATGAEGPRERPAFQAARGATASASRNGCVLPALRERGRANQRELARGNPIGSEAPTHLTRELYT
jgi:hypothetical protein